MCSRKLLAIIKRRISRGDELTRWRLNVTIEKLSYSVHISTIKKRCTLIQTFLPDGKQEQAVYNVHLSHVHIGSSHSENIELRTDSKANTLMLAPSVITCEDRIIIVGKKKAALEQLFPASKM